MPIYIMHDLFPEFVYCRCTKKLICEVITWVVCQKMTYTLAWVTLFLSSSTELSWSVCHFASCGGGCRGSVKKHCGIIWVVPSEGVRPMISLVQTLASPKCCVSTLSPCGCALIRPANAPRQQSEQSGSLTVCPHPGLGNEQSDPRPNGQVCPPWQACGSWHFWGESSGQVQSHFSQV